MPSFFMAACTFSSKLGSSSVVAVAVSLAVLASPPRNVKRGVEDSLGVTKAGVLPTTKDLVGCLCASTSIPVEAALTATADTSAALESDDPIIIKKKRVLWELLLRCQECSSTRVSARRSTLFC